MHSPSLRLCVLCMHVLGRLCLENPWYVPEQYEEIQALFMKHALESPVNLCYITPLQYPFNSSSNTPYCWLSWAWAAIHCFGRQQFQPQLVDSATPRPPYQLQLKFQFWRNSTAVQSSHDIHSAMESHVQVSRRAWALLWAFSCLLALELVHASDPDPLQDFCVADYSSNAPRVNGYPCKLRSNVTAKDFVFTAFRKGMVNCLIYGLLILSCASQYLTSSCWALH